MKYTKHPEYKTAFTKRVELDGRIHALIQKAKPWFNGFIERSNRTDNENLFHRLRFKDSEERSYQLRLWEMEYNMTRPHQGIQNKAPAQIAKLQHPLWAYVNGIT